MLNCFIYKSRKKDGTYIFVAQQEDFSSIPAEFMKALGKLEQVMQLELTPERKLAQADASDVIKNIQKQGFHIQFTPSEIDTRLPLAKKQTRK